MTREIQDDNASEAGMSSDVCIVGAGLAGLNALFVASRYLTRGQRVIVIDRRLGVGGMWADTYPYVRLHQPYPLFTAGDIGWGLDEPRSHLASKEEVLKHFQLCLARIKSSVEVVELWGWNYISHVETDASVHVVCASPDGQTVTIAADRLIKAQSGDVSAMPALSVSSQLVRSVSPDECDVRVGEFAASQDPVWLVGGGKTAMDTALAIMKSNPGRQVNLIAGDGTVFGRRELFFPEGLRRWIGGKPFSSVIARTARQFDGTNEAHTLAWFGKSYGVAVTGTFQNFFLGFLSQAEANVISAGLDTVVMDYLQDVADVNGEPQLRFRSGAVRAITAGSWLVNCTGYLTQRLTPYEPYVSASGKVLSLNARSMLMHLIAYRAYFLTHLLFLNKLALLPLYELDPAALRTASKAAFPMTVATLSAYNLSLIADAVPRKVFEEAGIDFDFWYPAPRRTLTRLAFALSHRRARPRQRRTLDTVRERFGVHCGPVVPPIPTKA